MLASRLWSGMPSMPVAPVTPGTAESVFLATELLLPPVLLVVFLVTGAIYTVATSSPVEQPAAKGPGGKPLPVNTCKEQAQPEKPALDAQLSTLSKRIFQYVSVATVASFLVNGASVALHALQVRDQFGRRGGWWCGEERVVYVVGSAALYTYVVISLFGKSQIPTIVHLVLWFLALVGECVLLVSFFIFAAGEHHIQLAHVRDGAVERIYKPATGFSGWDTLDLCVALLRVCLVGFLVGLYITLAAKKCIKERRIGGHGHHDVDEARPLLSGDRGARPYQTNDEERGRADDVAHAGAKGSSVAGSPQQDDHAAFYRPVNLPHKNWYEYCRSYSIFFPYLWPNDSAKLQLVVLLCSVLALCQRVVNVMVPYQMGTVTDALENNEGSRVVPWAQLLLLIGFKLLQGQSGLLGSLRSILWIPVSQHTYRALLQAAFEHVHSLSWEFHTGKRTGEVLSALNKGASLNVFLEQVTFQVFPMLVDLIIAIIFFQIRFGAVYALYVSIITFYYLHLTIRMAATRADQRREMVNADRDEEALKNESIQGYETVKYFNAEAVEFQRFRDAVAKFQKAEYKVNMGLSHMNMAQSLVFMCGILVCMMTCAFEVTQGLRTTGDFVLLVTYLGQLQGPLNFFGAFYRILQQAMISAERLLELFKIQPNVVDQPGVKPLPEGTCKGHIKWDRVGFSYDERRSALHDMSFECQPGTTTAFVGESGGGKSTVFRLMYRFFDVRTGSISLDGHDMRDFTIDSVRRNIGVVPQDTALFNETIMYNLRYAKAGVTNEEVYAACKAAAIHDRIMSFPDGYDTKVGDRGMRLSGGEKQRVAIARTILKNPKIIMLDEATSALDGETEQKIQSGLISGNFARDRTLLVIAHRLSTVTHADQILVLHNGTIAERGTHESLLAQRGQYAKMWDRHCRAERAAELARVATDKAKRLAIKANTARADEQSDGCSSMASSGILHTGMTSTDSGEDAGASRGKSSRKPGQGGHHLEDTDASDD